MKKIKIFISMVIMMALFLVPLTANAEENYQPGDFRLVNPGETAGTLTDSKNTIHTITLKEVADNSSDKFRITITESVDNPAQKDNSSFIEFYSLIGNKMSFSGYEDWDTTGKAANTYTALLPKTLYQNREFIYIVYGTSEDPDDDYYSDIIQFKIQNPFYIGEGDTTPPAKPNVLPVSDKDTQIRGTTEPNVLIGVDKDDVVFVFGMADDKGNFSIPIKPLKAGVKLSVIAMDASLNVSDATVLTVLDKTPPVKPVINPIGDHMTAISGSAEKDSKVYVLNGSKIIGSATSKGTFTVTIPKQLAGTTLSVYSVDAAGNKSPIVAIKVLDKTPPAIAAVNAVTSKSKTVSGKAEKGATVTVYNGKKAIGTATVGTNGAFTVKIAAQKKGTKLTLTAKDKAGNVTNKTIIVK